MPIDLTGRTIAITGASSGIGEATALACAAAGMRVALAARRLDRLTTLADRINAAGGRAMAVQLDVADAPACRAFIQRAHDELGGLYAVFANAGYGVEQTIPEMSEHDIRTMFEVNFFGSLNVIRPALDLMLAGQQAANEPSNAPRGHLLFCSSCLALYPVPFGGCYSATKAAQHHFARAMRIELEPQRVHVSSVHPIGTATEFSTSVLARSGKPERTRTTPGMLMQPPQRVADAVVACLRRPRAEVWPGVRANATRALMAAASVCAPFGDVIRRRLVAKRNKTP